MPDLPDVIPRRDGASAPPRRRIAIVVQRYGLEVNGGAELHARLVATLLARDADVDVLTSCALDYRSWDRHYPPGESWIEGVRVIRFEHPQRGRRSKRHMPLLHKLRFKCRHWLRRHRDPALPLVARPSGRPSDGLPYLEAQGPTMPGLMTWLKDQGETYDALIFFTALYHPSALGVLVQPRRSLLVPTLHDEKSMYLPHYHRVFRAPRQILYNTPAEQRLAARLYGADIAPGSVCGVGIDVPATPTTGAAERTRPYLVYVGRVDKGKGCDELFAHFQRLVAEQKLDLDLVVVGQAFMTLPQHERIDCVGFVDESRKFGLMAGAEALVLPSRYESLSLVLLESLAMGRPVIVNGDCEVLVDHVQASQAGWTYRSYEEFRDAVRALLARPPAQRERQARSGREYVAQHYSWDAVGKVLWSAIDEIAAPRSTG